MQQKARTKDVGIHFSLVKGKSLKEHHFLGSFDITVPDDIREKLISSTQREKDALFTASFPVLNHAASCPYFDFLIYLP